MAGSLLQKWFPQTAKPLIISAPMFTVCNGKLAAEVTKAGGLGTSFSSSKSAFLSPYLIQGARRKAATDRI
jgi:NAD(P)H-dependent flavin oxidoreductase YrpB (nitropropane dioxygenase family)